MIYWNEFKIFSLSLFFFFSYVCASLKILVTKYTTPLVAWGKSFGWILLNPKFIFVIGTIPSYLGNWGKRVNFGNGVAEIQQKYERERKKVEEGKFWISVITLPKLLLPKSIVAIPLPK